MIISRLLVAKAFMTAITKLAKNYGTALFLFANHFSLISFRAAQFISTRSKFRAGPRICACVRDQRYTTDIGSNYILQSDATPPWQPQKGGCQRRPSCRRHPLSRPEVTHIYLVSAFQSCASVLERSGQSEGGIFSGVIVLGKKREIKDELHFTRIAIVIRSCFIS